MNTTTLIKKMLKENTGEHFLDSGGAYGRHWEKNKDRDFEKEPIAKWDNYGVTLSTFHFLKANLDYSEDAGALDAMFRRKFKERQYADACEFAQWIDPEFKGDGFNTYNGDCALDQTLRGAMFDFQGRRFVALQVHGGCDVRGGYSDARIFELVNDYLFVADFSVKTKKGSYRTNDTYNFYNDDGNDKKTWEELFAEGVEEVTF